MNRQGGERDKQTHRREGKKYNNFDQIIPERQKKRIS